MNKPLNKKPTLPYGWIERISTTFPDRVYYFNTLTGASTWIVPFMHKTHPADKRRAKTPPLEQDSGISSISGASLSSHGHEQGEEKEFVGPNLEESVAEFSPGPSPRSVSDDGSVDLLGNMYYGNAPMWSEFMDNYIKQSEQNDQPDSYPSRTDQLQNVAKRVIPREDVASTSKNVVESDYSRSSDLRVKAPKRNVQKGPEVMVRGGRIIPSPALEAPNDREVELGEMGREAANKSSSSHIKANLLRTPDKLSENNVEIAQRVVSAEKRQLNLSWSKRHWEDQEYSGPPRISVKDRLGWVELKQKKKKKKKRKQSNQKQGETVESDNNAVMVAKDENILNVEEDVIMLEDCGDDEGEIGGTPMDVSEEPTTVKPKVLKTKKPKTPVKAPPPAQYKGPLTVFSPASLSDKGSETLGALESTTQTPIKRLNIILDTNIFLSHLSFVEELRDENIPGFGRPMLIIPWIVLHELDSLKEGKDIKDVRKHFRGSVVSRAQSAVHFINSCLTNKHPRVQGQSIQECSRKGGVYTRSNDDKILQCCLQYKNRDKNTTENVLFSEDMSLRNKAIVCGIHAYTQSGLMKGLEELAKELPKRVPTRSRTTDAKLSHKKSPRTTPSEPKSSVKVLPEKAAAELVDDMICKLKNALRGPLSVVLEAEMKGAFEDLWLDVVLKKPPWTFLDILDCYEKHWIAVFSCICNRSIRNCFDKLRMFYKVNKGLGANLKITKDLLEAGLEFLSHLKNHSSYSGAMDGPVSHLAYLLEQVNLLKTTSSASSTTPPSSSKPQLLYSSKKHSSPPSVASEKSATSKTLKKVLERSNKTVKTRPTAKKQTSSEAIKPGDKPKKIKINRASISSKLTPNVIPKISPKISRKSVEGPRLSSLEQAIEQEVAMDTSSDQISPGRTASGESIGQSDMPTMWTPKAGEGDSDMQKLNVSPENGKASAHKFLEDSQNEPQRPFSSDEHSSKSILSHSSDVDMGTDQPKEPMSKSPLAQCTGNVSSLSSYTSSSLCGDASPASSTSGMLYTPPSREEQVRAHSHDVLRVLDTAYKEMYALCVKVGESVRMQELGERSTAQLSLKEAFTLVEYLVGYLEKQIVAMKKVLSVVKGNGLMGSISDEVYQELIDIIDGFFIGMEINLDGSNLTVEMLKDFITRDENLLSLERGIEQYQVSLEGCKLCYNVLSQVQT